MAVQPIPGGYENPIPSLTVAGAAEAIDFYKRAFGARERRAWRDQAARSLTRSSR